MPNFTQLRRPYTSKPPAGVRPTPSVSLGSGLSALWGLAEGGGSTTREGLRGLGGTLGSASSWGSTPLGTGVTNTAATSAGIITLSGPLSLSTLPCTLLAWVVLPTASTAGAFVKIGDQASGFALGVGGTTMDGAGNHLLGLIETVAWVPSGVNIGTGAHQVALTVDAAKNYALWLDGKQVFTLNVGSVPTPAANSASLLGYAARNPQATLIYAATWTRALTGPEIQRLYSSPFALWAGTALPLVAPPGAGSSGAIGYSSKRLGHRPTSL